MDDQPEDILSVLSGLLGPEDIARVRDWLEDQEIEKRNEDYVLDSDDLIVRLGWRRQSKEAAPAAAETFFGIRIVRLLETEN